MKGIGHMLAGGSARTDEAPARNAIRLRRHPQASTIVWAQRVSVTAGAWISLARGRVTAQPIRP